MTGQILDPNPGKNEKSAVVENPLPSLLPLLSTPADPKVPPFQRKGRRPEADGTDNPLIGIDQIAGLRTGERAMTEVVITIDQAIPQQRLFFVLHLVQLDRTQF